VTRGAPAPAKCTPSVETINPPRYVHNNSYQNSCSYVSTCEQRCFSGTGSVGQTLAKLGFEVVSVDSDSRSNPSLCVDVLTWDYKKQFPQNYFQVIAAGVPCTEYSQAKTTQPRNIELADKLVAKTLEIIDYFNPRIWWVENPRGGLLKDRDVIRDRSYIDVGSGAPSWCPYFLLCFVTPVIVAIVSWGRVVN